jgi:hypothetical protein
VRGGERLPCQVCGVRLAPRADGLARPHGRHYDCRGVGYRLARWPVGQRLQHHTTGVWEVVEDHAATRWADYLIRCVTPTRSLSGGGFMEEPGVEVVVHGEYLHRHGWTPVPSEGGQDRG